MLLVFDLLIIWTFLRSWIHRHGKLWTKPTAVLIAGGSLKRECLDQRLIIHRNQLNRVVKEYTDYYNRPRPHPGPEQRIPARFNGTTPSSSGKILSTPGCPT